MILLGNSLTYQIRKRYKFRRMFSYLMMIFSKYIKIGNKTKILKIFNFNIAKVQKIFWRKKISNAISLSKPFTRESIKKKNNNAS